MFKIAKISKMCFHPHFLYLARINETKKSLSPPLICIFMYMCKVKVGKVAAVYQKITVGNGD